GDKDQAGQGTQPQETGDEVVYKMGTGRLVGVGVLAAPGIGGQQQAEGQGQKGGQIIGGEQGGQAHQQHGRCSDPVDPYPQMEGVFLLSHRRLRILILRHETLPNLVASGPAVEWQDLLGSVNWPYSPRELISL